jgi:predicted AAA+ superfamily ATPase
MIKNSRESLAGRSKEYILSPLLFSEFLSWQKEPFKPFNVNLFQIYKMKSLYQKLFFLKKVSFFVLSIYQSRWFSRDIYDDFRGKGGLF